jgi:glycosyltransferase involved in cell wall biosynthesis
MKVAILYNKLYEFDGTKLSIGGIQTYLQRLSEVVTYLGWEPAIFQLSYIDFERKAGIVKIYGKSGIPLDSTPKDIGEFLTRCAEKWIDGTHGIIIFGSDSYFVRSSLKSIAIQHGVSWDLSGSNASDSVTKYIHKLPARWHPITHNFVNKFRDSRINQIRRAWLSSSNEYNKTIKSMSYMVCVDYNYLNVSKAQHRIIKAKTWIIPNFADLATLEEISASRKGTISTRILFARRFVWYRGTRLIAPVFRRIINEFPNLSITFAGDGPDEIWLREYFADSERVIFLKYNHSESSGVLLSHDIALIPSLGSEGTSLSAIEAMAAGCVVVATCVGGLTNIIIDGYNGKLVMPEEEELYSALHEVITDITLRHRLAERAYETIKESLNIDLWREKWRRVLLHVSGIN